jgi:muramidase (phage lysozyme)
MALYSSAFSSSLNLKNIKKSLSSLGESVRNARNSSFKITNSIRESNRDKRKSLSLSSSLFRRRREATLRKDREDLLEARTVGGSIKRSGKVIMNSTKGFLGRILDFLGTILLGWAINNLPKIIDLAEKLIKRMQQYFGVLQDFVGGVFQTLNGFVELIGGITTSIASFDFSNFQNVFDSSIGKMQTGLDKMMISTEKSLRMLTKDVSSMLKLMGVNLSDFDIPDLIEPEDTSAGTDTGGGSPGSSPTPSRGQYTGKAANIPPEGKALLDAIAGSESGGYNSRYPSKTFSGYDDHPRIDERILSGPNKGLTSNAAGRYQFLSTTWDQWKPGNAFTPENQDIAAYNLAIAAYGYGEQGLLKALRENPLAVANKLSGTWTSLPGGIEPNNATNGFISRYKKSVERYYNTPSPIFTQNQNQQPPEPEPEAQPSTNTFDFLKNLFTNPPKKSSSITGAQGRMVASSGRSKIIIINNEKVVRVPVPSGGGGGRNKSFSNGNLDNGIETAQIINV